MPANGVATIILETPLIALNSLGHPCTSFPYAEIAGAMAIEKAFGRVEWHSGYLSHQNLPRQQTPALAPGSTFVIRVNKSFEPGEAESRGYGLRTEEGFGRIRVLKLSGLANLRTETSKATSAVPSPPSTKAVSDLALAILRQRAEDYLRIDQSDIPSKYGKLRPHLVQRLISCLEEGGLERLSGELTGLHDKARGQLESCAISNRGTLLEYLREICKNTREEFVRLARNVKFPALFPNTDPAGYLAEDKVYVHATMSGYLIRRLSSISRRVKLDGTH